MKTLSLLFVVLSTGAVAQANDGGVAAIEVNEIRMREYQLVNGEERELRRIVNPNFRITFSGGEAAKLQKILPSEVSVITHMQPELTEAFNETFKTLGIYSEKTPQVSAKTLTISCADGELKLGDDGQAQIVKTGKTTCTISIQGVEEGIEVTELFGAMQPFTPPMCH